MRKRKILDNDGIYNLVRYWSEKGKDGFVTYKYQFRIGRSSSSTMDRRGRSEGLGTLPEDCLPRGQRGRWPPKNANR
ncbi:hypothetical protein BGX38DRAFT_1187954 [Terfezia claveryi]|nr:hypothetical protein BGX38DRAFT_1241852 [Terfezia claveryi]KAF8449588.1 hypothetical protein BGX38DRAFT_1187954 [Terfezia claveryi]